MNTAEIRFSAYSRPQPEVVRKIRTIAEKLESKYGPKVLRKKRDPLSQLIVTILSQNTTDANSLRAFRSLRERFPTWPQVHRASVQEVADAIWSGGLARTKAHRIKKILVQICPKYPRCDLSFLSSWPTERIRSFLRGFTGVGEKTIACVLLFALKRPVMPVDTHVLRVSKRLGLISFKVGAKGAHQLLQAMIPQSLVYPLHLNLVEHGRTTCKARNPDCDQCPLGSECLTYATSRAENH